MHLLPRMNAILDFIWTLLVQLQGTRNKWKLQKNPVHGRIRTPTWHDLQVTSPSSSPHGHNTMELNAQLIYIYTIYNKLEQVYLYRINNVSAVVHFILVL